MGTRNDEIVDHLTSRFRELEAARVAAEERLTTRRNFDAACITQRDEAQQERDEARREAARWRDAYATLSINAIHTTPCRLPWEREP